MIFREKKYNFKIIFKNYNLWPLNVFHGPSPVYCIKQMEESISALRFKVAHSVSIIKAHIWPNKKIGVLRVTGLKTLGRVGRHTCCCFFNCFFSGKQIILCILKDILPFKMHKIIFFPENLGKKKTKSPVNLAMVRVTLNTGIFIWPYFCCTNEHYIYGIFALLALYYIFSSFLEK